MLPATKAVPKEMLPIVDKPLLQYAVEEAVGGGITEIIFVVAEGKEAVREHFSSGGRTDALISAKQDPALQALVRSPAEAAAFHYFLQDAPLGPGHALLCARELLHDEPFVVMFPDDLILGRSCVAELIDAHEETGGCVIAVERVPWADVPQYGIVDPAGEGDPIPLRGLVEKPPADEAPSDLGIVGRYVLTPDLLERIAMAPTGKGGERYLTEGLADHIAAGGGVFAKQFSARRFDTGRPAGYLAASVATALCRPDIADDVRARLSILLNEEAPG